MAATGLMKRPSRGLLDVLIPRNEYGPPRLPGPTDDYWYEPKGGFAAGQQVTGRTALTLSGCWAATNAIAGLMGQLPLKPYKKTSEGREEATKHETYTILSREPNPDMDSFVFWEMMAQWFVNYGNAFAEKQVLEGSGRLYALWPIHPSRVRPERDGDKNWTGRWLVRNNGTTFSVFEGDEILNIVGNLSDDGITGKGVLAYAASAVGVGLAQAQYEGDFYGNGGRPSGVLEHPSKLSESARDNLRREWKTVHGKSNEVAVLWEGLKFNPLTVDPDHAKLIDSRVFNVQEMCRFYDVPPHVLYDLSHGTFANTEEMNRFLISQPFGKRLVRVEKALDRQLFTDAEKKAGYYTKFNVNALLRGNPKEQAEIAQLKIRAGVITPNEARAQDDMNPIPGEIGDTHFLARDVAPMQLIADTPLVPASQPIPSTPDSPKTPETPPTPKNRKFSRALNAMKAKLAEAIQERDLEKERAQAAEDAKSQAVHDRMQVKERVDELTAEVATTRQILTAATDELASVRESAKEDRDALAGELATLRTDRDTLSAWAADLETQNTHLEGHKTELAGKLLALSTEKEALDARLLVAVEGATVAARERDAAGESNTKLMAALEAAEQQHDQLKTTLEAANSQLSKAERAHESATARADSLKAQVDKLATELGTVRAERDQHAASLQVATKSRDESLVVIAEYRQKCEAAQNDAKTARGEAAQTEKNARERVSGARSAVAAALRNLLDESLAALIAQEQHEVKTASRKPEQFKEITSSYYHHFATKLTAQLEKADLAMAELGCARHDVAKLAAQYVSESRTRLNNVFNTTKQADLRVAVRQEADSWDSRRQSLLDWIGD